MHHHAAWAARPAGLSPGLRRRPGDAARLDLRQPAGAGASAGELGANGASRAAAVGLSFQPKRRDYLAFLGRISPEKRIDRAIAIAVAAGLPLKIAAKVRP